MKKKTTKIMKNLRAADKNLFGKMLDYEPRCAIKKKH